MFCDSCGAPNRPQATFCSSCGQRLQGGTGIRGTISKTLTGLLVRQHMLNRRYSVVAQVGKGGFGAVYKAADTYFGNRAVAVKEMSQSNLSPQELAEATRAFKQEALLLANLHHPNLPAIYDQFYDGGRWYLVMDYIEGETLETRLERVQDGKLPVEQALNIAIQACSVLDYLHTRQPPIIFRDLKPANVMLTADEHLYLIDFGIARHFKPGQTKDTAALGSSGYAAPEQYGKAQTTPRADLYGLGATLHQMLTGDDPSLSPFHFAPLRQRNLMLSSSASTAIPMPVGALSHLEKLLIQLVEMNADKRPVSAAMVQQELQEIAALCVPGAGTKWLATRGKTGIPAGYRPPTSTRRPPAFQPQQNTLFICSGHSSRVTALAWSPDGKRIASANFDKTVRIWDAGGGKELFCFRGYAAHVTALAWSPDGRRIASASDDYTVQIWDAANGNVLFTYRGHVVQVTAVAWSPDGFYLASGSSDTTVQVWNTATGAALSTFKNHSDRVTAFAPSLSAQPGMASLQHLIMQMVELDAAKRPQSAQVVKRELQEIATQLLQERLRSLYPLPVDRPSSSSFIQPYVPSSQIGGGGQGQIQIGQPTQNSVKRGQTRRRFIRVAAGAILTTIAASSVMQLLGNFESWPAPPPGRPAQPAQVSFGDAPVGYTYYTYTDPDGSITGVSWSPDGKYIVMGGYSQVARVFRADSDESLGVHNTSDGPIFAVAWSGDGNYIATATRTVQVWYPPMFHSAFHTTYTGHRAQVNAISWSPDNQYIASASDDGTVQVWHALTAKQVNIYRGHRGAVKAVAWSPDNSFIASGDAKGEVHIWQPFHVSDPLRIYKGHTAQINGIAWSAASYGNYVASASDDGTVQVWNALTGETLTVYKHHHGAIRAVVWTPTDMRVASAGDDLSVRIWDALGGDDFFVYQQNTQPVVTLTWSPDGKMIVSGSLDGTMQVWQAD